MTREGGRLRATLVLLLLVSAALFAVGAAVERHQHTEATPSASETSAPTEATPSEGRAVDREVQDGVPPSPTRVSAPVRHLPVRNCPMTCPVA